MTRIVLFIVFGCCVYVVAAQNKTALNTSTVKKTPPVEWPTLRANNNRDGRVVARGAFKDHASLQQTIDFSTSESYIELFPDESKTSVAELKAGDINPDDKRHAIGIEWQTNLSVDDQTATGAYLDLYGDGNLTLVSQSQNSKYFKLFEGDNRYYRIQAFDGFGTTVNVHDDAFIGVRVYEANTDKQLFEKRLPKGEYMQRPHITVADMDNDGSNDIVITSWEGIYIFNNRGDLIGGLSQKVPGWHNLRKRGFACLKDIDGNGYKDVIIISTLPWHVDVIKNDKGSLRIGWTRIFDGLVETARKISKPILGSVNDFDGDGTYEVFVNVYNFNDDNNWSGVLFDATDGSVKAQIRNAYVVSAEDVNNNGKYVFFCTETQGQSVPSAASLRAVTFSDGRVHELLRVDHAEWINPRMPNTSPTVTTHNDGISSIAEDVVLCKDYNNSGHKSFFIKSINADGSSVINSYHILDKRSVKDALAIRVPAGMYGEILRHRATDNQHSLLLQVKAFGRPAGTVRITGASSRTLGRYIIPGSKTFMPVVADINADGYPEILITNEVGEVLCFGRDAKGNTKLLWSVAGHGMTWQYSPALDYGVAVDDLDHDGKKEVIVSGADEAGAVLFVYDSKGKMRWKAGFPEIHAGELTSWDGNLAFYATVQSSKRKHRDVVVTVQRGIAHGGKTYCLNGMDGSEIWKLDRLEADFGSGNGRLIDSGAGGYVLSAYDIDGDGADEVMCGYGNVVFFANSNDGTIRFKAFMRKVFTDYYDYPAHGYESFWMQQITPVAFMHNGTLELACFNTMVAAGTMSTKGSLIWSPTTLDYKDRYWQCMANLEGDGKLWVVEIASRTSDNVPELFAYDPATGEMHKNFTMDMPGFVTGMGAAIMPIAADVNGDGKDEILISNNTGVHCVGMIDGKVQLNWKFDAPGCGPVVVADVDADGLIEAITATKDGRVLVLGK